MHSSKSSYSEKEKMNSLKNKKLLYIATQEFPGIPLNYNNQIKGYILPKSESKSISERLNLFLEKQNINLEISTFVTCIVDKIDKNEILKLRKCLPELNHIANFGVGFNNIDISFAKELGIRVTNTPGVLTEATADIALTLLLCVTRRIADGYSMMKDQGKYPGWSPTFMLGQSMQNKTLGIVGYGKIGQAFAKRAQALGMKCVALKSESWAESKNNPNDIKRLNEKDFLATIDVLSLNCPLTDSSKYWLNSQRISMIKPGSFVINTARGELIDEQALADALSSDHLAGAGLDVFCNEPNMSLELQKAKNLFVLPHLGSATVETRHAMGERVFEAIKSHYIERYEKHETGVLLFQVN
ncbi:D-glycerate dehydrogenase [Fluviispira sanaruensis]|uniref:D-glycerate dehydrogenase n=2 Tax=Fluviispira sanaruensis TaxID=2493639 RepID=A0A4P2VLI6_FLUSA|nr:D-glycerate dehydrogenase [Fluviispira sanaruensis]